MSEDIQQFEFNEVRAIRGLVEQTKTKWEKEGWEFVSQSDGKLQSKLTFRRPKKKFPFKLVTIGGGAFVLIMATIITIGTVTERGTKPASEAATTVTTTVASPIATPTETANEILTVENNADLARLLSDKGEDVAFWQEFYNKYQGRTIEFDGNISVMNPLQDTKYTYMVGIYAGDYSETSIVGPPFRESSVVVPLDWNLTNRDDYISQGTNVRIILTLRDYNKVGNVFDVWIDSTTVR